MRDRSTWGWNWSSVKTVLEWLFYCGDVTSAFRNTQFERVYDLPERVLPAKVLAAPTPDPAESVTGLVRRAAQALGVASEFCLRDYFRTRPAMTREAIATLVEAGELLPVTIQGWENKLHFVWHETRWPRRIEARALLSPFDSMIFERSPAGAAVRLRLPDRDLCSGSEAGLRLLRLPLPARRALRRARRPQGRSRPQCPSGELGLAGAGPRSGPASRPSWPPSSRPLAAWQGLSAVEVLPRGDLAASLAAAAA